MLAAMGLKIILLIIATEMTQQIKNHYINY